MDLYAYQILDHYKQPRNYGVLEGADASSEQANLSCGDNIVMYLKVDEGVLRNIKFTGDGCAISKATASMLTEKLVGRRGRMCWRWILIALGRFWGLRLAIGAPGVL